MEMPFPPLTPQPMPHRSSDDKWLQIFDTAHEAGAQLHPETWYTVNHSVVMGIAPTYGLDLRDAKTRAMLSEIVLRVLNAVEAP